MVTAIPTSFSEALLHAELTRVYIISTWHPLGKSSENQYSLTAIDCNGISSITETVETWPVVLITTPMDKYLGGTVTLLFIRSLPLPPIL